MSNIVSIIVSMRIRVSISIPLLLSCKSVASRPPVSPVTAAVAVVSLHCGGEDFHLAARGPGAGVRGWGLIRPQGEQEEEQEGGSSGSRESASMASELRMTRKCVLSDGVMVSSIRSELSFLLT